MGFSFHFSSLYPAPYIELYVCYPIWISYLNFRAVLVLPKTAGSAQTHKSMSFIWIVWSTLYVYLCLESQKFFSITRTIFSHSILEILLYQDQRYTHRVLQTIQMKLILLWVWAEQAVLGRAKTALKIQVWNLDRLTRSAVVATLVNAPDKREWRSVCL